MNAAAAVMRGYAALALRLDRLEPGAVEAYDGDPALRRTVADEPLPPPAELVRQAERLALLLPDAGLDPLRAESLAGQLRAAECCARRLAGQRIPVLDELRACYDTTAGFGDEDEYRAAHRRIDSLLPGSGPLGERLAAHRRRDAVPAGLLAPAARALSDALLARARVPYATPAAESVEHEVVPDAPWSALHRYAGAGRSVVRINGALRPRAGRLAALVAHETGHHLERCRAEASGRPERALVLGSSPQSLLAEGLAETLLDVLIGPGWGRWSADVLADAGVRTDGELAERLDEALAPLQRVRVDAVLMHDRRTRVDDAVTHLRRWLLVEERRARLIVSVIADPRTRTRAVADVHGSALVAAFLGGAPSSIARHRWLLDAMPAPAVLRAAERTCSPDGRVRPGSCDPEDRDGRLPFSDER